jgi:hypothetical protein
VLIPWLPVDLGLQDLGKLSLLFLLLISMLPSLLPSMLPSLLPSLLL